MRKKFTAKSSKGDKSVADQGEIVRLTIQIGVVASCLVVISGDFGSLTPGFQLITKILALLLGLLSMAYIMLTGRMFGFKDRRESKTRLRLYDFSITFYWYIFFMMAYLFFSDLIVYLVGVSFDQLYVCTWAVMIIGAIISLCILKLKPKK